MLRRLPAERPGACCGCAAGRPRCGTGLRPRWTAYAAAAPAASGPSTDARPVDAGFGRRRMLAAAPLLCLAAAAPASSAEPDPRGGRPPGRPTVDMHSHAGKLLSMSAAAGRSSPLADPMREGGLAVACLAIVSDAPTHRVGDDHRIQAFPQPGAGRAVRLFAQRRLRPAARVGAGAGA